MMINDVNDFLITHAKKKKQFVIPKNDVNINFCLLLIKQIKKIISYWRKIIFFFIFIIF